MYFRLYNNVVQAKMYLLYLKYLYLLEVRKLKQIEFLNIGYLTKDFN